MAVALALGEAELDGVAESAPLCAGTKPNHKRATTSDASSTRKVDPSFMSLS